MAKKLLLAAMRADPHEVGKIIHSERRWADQIRRDLLHHIAATTAGRLAPRTPRVNEMGDPVPLARKQKVTPQERPIHGIHVAIVAGQDVAILCVLFAAAFFAAAGAEVELGVSAFRSAGALVEGGDGVAVAMRLRAVQTHVVVERVRPQAELLPGAAGAVDAHPVVFAVEFVA